MRSEPTPEAPVQAQAMTLIETVLDLDQIFLFLDITLVEGSLSSTKFASSLCISL